MARSNGGNGPIVCDLGRMVPELRVERERSRLVIEELTNLIDGSESFTERRREVERTILQNPVFNQEDRYNLTNDELFTRAVEKLVECAKFNSWDQYEKLQMMRTINEEAGTFIQEYFFKGTIESQGTEEQKAKWVPPAKEYSILGTYAQTELGHGSNIQNLETTATYDPSTQEFILHSPTLTSIKWWPGSLGHTATHAIVVARLIIKGKDHGIHLFIVQLRSLKDHKRLPGIETGDIGPKFGYNGVDNGYLKLTNVRIPRDQMLMKHAQVSPEGVYCKPPTNKKVSYSTMLLMRTGIALDIPCKLARAVTIATRYSVVRRQSQIKKNEPEVQVIHYQTQQFKLLPLLATAYTFSFTSVYMIQMFLEIQMNIAKDNLMSLSEHHATSAGLKAFLTDTCCKGMEVCRLACGGHGYLLASGIPTLYVNCTAAQTYEGENTVLYLEAAKYLHKMFNQRLTQSQLPPNIVYLACDYPKHTSCVAHTPEQFSDHNILLEAYARRARMMVEIAATQYQCTKSSGLNDVEAWNASSVDWTNAAKAHCNFVVLRISIETVQNANVSPANLAILKTLCSLYALYGIVESSGEFALDGYLSTKQIRNGRKYFYSLLKIVRHEAVPLVDAFDIPDAVLNSALGRYDGKVYRDLYERALKAPRNKSEVHEVYYKYLRPMIKSGVAAKL